MTETSELTAIAAADLRPGDIVCDDHGTRRFAAFDVHPVERTDGGTVPLVRVWTALADQEDRGHADSYLIVAEDLLWVRR